MKYTVVRLGRRRDVRGRRVNFPRRSPASSGAEHPLDDVARLQPQKNLVIIAEEFATTTTRRGGGGWNAISFSEKAREDFERMVLFCVLATAE
jgi:hypothetical protein